MKTFIFLLAGVSVGVAYMIANQKAAPRAKMPAPVEDMAHKLQNAWADHHTVA